MSATTLSVVPTTNVNSCFTPPILTHAVRKGKSCPCYSTNAYGKKVKVTPCKCFDNNPNNTTVIDHEGQSVTLDGVDQSD